MQEGSNATPSAPAAGDGTGHTAPQIGDPASIHVIVGTSRARVVLSGEIDADVSAELGEAISDAEASGLPVELDAHHVTFMDSSGVAFLARLASRSPHKVRVLRAPPTVRFLLEVTRIGELLEIVDEDPGVDLDITTAGPR
ncbi:anti-anti-sigma factor [Isoptericola halotolerans]|uniref:Anti-anti-sigma factor n=1 Tax=Isoptericola halotolerans TaxID=300560 RepID=A0ABX5EI71_9MICO|nr:MULTISPECIES: STAS domain-containing protein [Isoptericola]MCK0117670.1 STAS domain-containing protein [Isoptericola sp. S6320L]PRZ10181.1 anti-anti-sigma factor [Isoptericola halotolerans]